MFLGSLHLFLLILSVYSPVKFLVLFFLFKDLLKKYFGVGLLLSYNY